MSTIHRQVGTHQRYGKPMRHRPSSASKELQTRDVRLLRPPTSSLRRDERGMGGLLIPVQRPTPATAGLDVVSLERLYEPPASLQAHIGELSEPRTRLRPSQFARGTPRTSRARPALGAPATGWGFCTGGSCRPCAQLLSFAAWRRCALPRLYPLPRTVWTARRNTDCASPGRHQEHFRLAVTPAGPLGAGPRIFESTRGSKRKF